MSNWPIFDATLSWEEAQSALEEAGLSDGFPLVPPTEARLASMLVGVSEPDASHGMVMPMFGDLTARSVAYNCVLAGALPGAVPVVLTAVAAMLNPDFNLLGLMTTTGTPAVATIVHGQISERLGMNHGVNCLGPGNRANSTLGRSIALVLRNVGGAKETIGDMATMGQPGKLAFCFPENSQGGLPSLTERLGLGSIDAVTVLGVSGTMEVLPLDDRDKPEAILTPMAAALAASSAVAAAGRMRDVGDQIFLIGPEMVADITKHGWGINEIQSFMHHQRRLALGDVATVESFAPGAAEPTSIHPIVTGGPGVKMTCLPIWAGGSRIQTMPLISP